MVATNPERPRFRLPIASVEIQRARADALRALFGDDEAVHIGRYVLQGRIGLGGMGLVYQAFDPKLARSVALKVLPHRDALRPEFARTRLRREAQALARVESPHVVRVLDFGEVGGQPFFAMELVEGTTLARWLEEGPRSIREIVTAFIAAGRGLIDAHEVGIVHRDFKPTNVIVGPSFPDGGVRLVDFGLASSMARLHEDPQVAGTLGYMAPEVEAGEPASPRSDQYSLCVGLRDALRGRSVPRSLRRLIDRGLARDPHDRWPSLGELLVGLERKCEAGTRARNRWIVGSSLAAMTLALAWPSRETSCPSRDVPEAWSSSRRDRLEASYPGLVRHLDAYAGAWRRARVQACEMGREGTAAVGCLDRAMDGLSSRLKAFEGQPNDDATALALARLDPPESCFDPSREEPTALGRVAVEHLARARGLVQAHRTSEAEVELHRAIAAMGDQDVETRPEVQWLSGQLGLLRGDHVQARRDLSRAFFEARRQGHDWLVARAACALVDLELSLHHGDQARRWLRHVGAALDRLGDPPPLSAQLDRLMGRWALQRGDSSTARTRIRQALKLRRRWYGEESPALAALEYDDATLHVQMRDYDEARRLFERARDRWATAFGVRHPLVGLAWTSLGALEETRARYDAASKAYARAIDIFEDAGPGEPLRLAALHVNLGNLAYRQGRYDTATNEFDRAHAILETLESLHPHLGHVFIGWGNIARDRGDFESARTHYRRARELWEGVWGQEHPLVALAASSQAEAALATERHDEAEPLLEQSISIRERRSGVEDPSLAFPLTTLGRLFLERTRVSEAVRVLERALSLREQAGNLDPRLVAETRFALAKARLAEGRCQEALEQARAAATEFDSHGALASRDVERVRAWISGHRDACRGGG